MNDRHNKSSAIFTPSGCLTGNALTLFVAGSLSGNDLSTAQQHILDCPLCSDAADGLRIWLLENNSDNDIAADASETADKKLPKMPGKQSFAKVHSQNSSVTAMHEFHARTNMINERIKQRLHTHALIEATENKRLSYKPFIWIAAAASVLLLIGSFFVVWQQNKFDSQKLAEERADEMLMLESHSTSDTLTVLMPEGKTVLAMKDKQEKVNQKQAQNTSEGIVEDAEVFNQDDLNSSVSVSEMQEVAVIKEEYETTRAEKSYAPKTKNAGSAAKKAEIDDESQPVFTIVEEMPQFPGGESARNKFLAENLTYPQLATENGIQGTVYTQFIVDSKGNIVDVKIIRGIGGGCDEEALRVVKLMPRWKPGRQNGKTVRTLFNMPIYFKLD